jgi:tRNA pseudouridine38-40 synthase
MDVNMLRVAALVQYTGKSFSGSQYQVGVRTVQAELERALSLYLRSPIKASFSGRTDRGVHAAGQVIHFDVEQDELDLWRFCWALNGILPNDVSISRAQIVPDTFHARFSARKREYVYRILNRPQRSALLKDTHHFVFRSLDQDRMKAASTALLGSHDFQAFRSTNADKTSTICDVSRAELLNLGEGQLEFWIAANHFVYNMVRIVVGTLIEIGLGQRAPESLSEALVACDRNLAGPTAPPWGLSLNSVEYPEAYALFESNS